MLNDEAEDSLLATYTFERIKHVRDFVQSVKYVLKRAYLSVEIRLLFNFIFWKDRCVFVLEWEKESFRVGPIINGASEQYP